MPNPANGAHDRYCHSSVNLKLQPYRGCKKPNLKYLLQLEKIERASQKKISYNNLKHKQLQAPSAASTQVLQLLVAVEMAKLPNGLAETAAEIYGVLINCILEEQFRNG